MLNVTEINSMKQIRDIIDEILRNLTYSSNNKDIINQMCYDTLELLFAYVLFAEEKERDLLEKLSNKRPVPGWDSFYDILMFLPIAGSLSKYVNQDYY